MSECFQIILSEHVRVRLKYSNSTGNSLISSVLYWSSIVNNSPACNYLATHYNLFIRDATRSQQVHEFSKWAPEKDGPRFCPAEVKLGREWLFHFLANRRANIDLSERLWSCGNRGIGLNVERGWHSKQTGSMGFPRCYVITR